MMKRKTNYYICIVLTLMLVLVSLSGCKGGEAQGTDKGGTDGGSEGAKESALSGSTEDILQKILDEAIVALGDEVPAYFIDPVTSENAPGMIGVLQDDFVSYVDEAAAATAAISTFAFQAAVIKCDDADNAKTIDKQITSGYDSGKWICAFPEQSMTVVSDSYILLAVGSVAQVTELSAAFKELAGGVASAPNIFYKGEVGGSLDEVE